MVFRHILDLVSFFFDCLMCGSAVEISQSCGYEYLHLILTASMRFCHLTSTYVLHRNRSNFLVVKIIYSLIRIRSQPERLLAGFLAPVQQPHVIRLYGLSGIIKELFYCGLTN